MKRALQTLLLRFGPREGPTMHKRGQSLQLHPQPPQPPQPRPPTFCPPPRLSTSQKSAFHGSNSAPAPVDTAASNSPTKTSAPYVEHNASTCAELVNAKANYDKHELSTEWSAFDDCSIQPILFYGRSGLELGKGILQRASR